MIDGSVSFTARCDANGCGELAQWRGVVTAIGGGTRYIVDCPACGIAPVDLRKIATPRDVETDTPQRAEHPLNVYWNRLLGRSA